MSTNKKEINEKKTIKYLENIFSEGGINNPTELDIPGFGKVTATSMVNYHTQDGQIIPHFTFRSKKGSGEFLREEKEGKRFSYGQKYFVEYNLRVQVGARK